MTAGEPVLPKKDLRPLEPSRPEGAPLGDAPAPAPQRRGPRAPRREQRALGPTARPATRRSPAPVPGLAACPLLRAPQALPHRTSAARGRSRLGGIRRHRYIPHLGRGASGRPLPGLTDADRSGQTRLFWTHVTATATMTSTWTAARTLSPRPSEARHRCFAAADTSGSSAPVSGACPVARVDHSPVIP
jgi:hypothetical protein